MNFHAAASSNSNQDLEPRPSNINCFNCRSKISGSITNQKSKCPAKTHICGKCQNTGHFEKVWRSVSVNIMIPEEDSPNKESIEKNMTKDSTFDFMS